MPPYEGIPIKIDPTRAAPNSGAIPIEPAPAMPAPESRQTNAIEELYCKMSSAYNKSKESCEYKINSVIKSKYENCIEYHFADGFVSIDLNLIRMKYYQYKRNRIIGCSKIIIKIDKENTFQCESLLYETGEITTTICNQKGLKLLNAAIDNSHGELSRSAITKSIMDRRNIKRIDLEFINYFFSSLWLATQILYVKKSDIITKSSGSISDIDTTCCIQHDFKCPIGAFGAAISNILILNPSTGDDLSIDISNCCRKFDILVFCSKTTADIAKAEHELFECIAKSIMIIGSVESDHKLSDIEIDYLRNTKNLILDTMPDSILLSSEPYRVSHFPFTSPRFFNFEGINDKCCLCGGSIPTTCCYPSEQNPDECYCPGDFPDSKLLRNLCEKCKSVYFTMNYREGPDTWNLCNWRYSPHHDNNEDVYIYYKVYDNGVLVKSELVKHDDIVAGFDVMGGWILGLFFPETYSKLTYEIYLIGPCRCCRENDDTRPVWHDRLPISSTQIENSSKDSGINARPLFYRCIPCI